jgi:hypothetical protein
MKILLLLATLATLGLTSCVSPYGPYAAGPGQTNGAIVGGVLGAVAGSAIGAASDANYQGRSYSRPYVAGTGYIQSYSYAPGYYGNGFGGYGGGYCAPTYGCGYSGFNSCAPIRRSFGCGPRVYSGCY